MPLGSRAVGTLPTADALRPILEQLGGPAALVRTAFEVMAAVRGLRSEPVNPALLVPSAAQFASLEIEELGYLYESLLEAGSRKHAGAHYTPRALADEVVLYALEPLVRDCDGSPLSSAELLDLQVADITCGSGVFLIAAAEYLAARVEEAWAREGVSGRSALRDVVTHCLYGADINPLAVEICRRSLWLLAGDRSLPLTFLDDRVLCGNSLLGVVDEVDVVTSAAADAFVATGLIHGGKPGPELEARYARLAAVAADGDEAALDAISAAGLTPTVPTDYARWQPLHWALAVPQVVARGGFDAVIGNPPFLGVKNIRGALGQNLRDYLARTLLDGGSGRSDLMVFFLARAVGLSRRTVGLVLSDAISEGDSARFGTAAATARGFRIYRAETSRPWPSAAGVRISLVWLARGAAGPATTVLDGHHVEEIGPGLGRAGSAAPAVRRPPPAYLPHGHQATIVLGKSLLLTPDQAAAMVAEDPRAAAWIREYLSGDDLVSTVGPRSSRLVLDVGDVDAEIWGAVPPVARHLIEVVLPERTAQWAKYPHLVERWWRFHNRVDRLYDEMAGCAEVVALAKHAKYIWPVLVSVGPVISNGAIVYPTDDRAVYGFLASEPHRLWAVEEGGSRLNQSHRYNPSRLLTTYPFPGSIDLVREPGERLAAAMDAARDQLGLGVTDILNQVHSVPSPAVEIERVRSSVVEVDRAVLAAHGFTIDLEHTLRSDGERTWFGPDASGTARLRARLLG